MQTTPENLENNQKIYDEITRKFGNGDLTHADDFIRAQEARAHAAGQTLSPYAIAQAQFYMAELADKQ